MLNWADVTVRQEQHRDRLRQAEQRRLVRELLPHSGQPRRLPLGPVLLGLVTWLFH
jgi:hypothetical protein